ncbi:hypothetical protein [Deinococcus ruber]|uniref:Uncharacterized protein n=1 Tax=Deinococcus ruber TaxID=1848197 RepID=A0A918BUN5_9DEIO|nr:hypothetical protein [Deinococcus ruber]GGQ92142.1 hypothetical protein GCM10008957_00060 [Deinococcus ruber]
MTDFADLPLPALADLLQQAYAADHALPGDHLTDPATRTALARFLNRHPALRAATIDAWLEDREAIEDDLLYWLEAEFLGDFEAPDREED